MDKQNFMGLRKKINLRLVQASIGIIIGILVALWTPPQGLSSEGMRGLGILLWAIFWWVFNVLPEYLTAMLMSALFIILGHVPTETVFASFASSTWWLLVAALGLGAGISKSGLLERMALVTLRFFPKSFKGQILGLLGVGTITAPFVPSLTAKAAMLAPVSMAMSDALGYERKGREASGLFAAMFTGIRNAAPVFISASVIGYMLRGLYPESVQTQFNMVYWFLCALPWGIVMSILNYFTIMTMYKPKEELQANMDFINKRLDALGPMGTKGQIMLVITILTVLLWATEPLHKLPPHVVGLIAICIALASGVFDRMDFRASITWDSLIFIGVVMNLSTIFKALNINNWILSIFSPAIKYLIVNPYLFVIGLALITVVVRFIIVSELAYISIFMAFLIPVAIKANINPWVVGMVIYCMVNPWLVLYQNPVYLTAYYSTQGNMVEHSEMARFCVIYLINSLIALLISVPFWQYLHLLPK
jgi:DASS family divalent anion:Na+ symporter